MIEPRTLDEISAELYGLSGLANILSLICMADPERIGGEDGAPCNDHVRDTIYTLHVSLERLAKEIDLKAVTVQQTLREYAKDHTHN